MKTCGSCKTEKPLTAFYATKTKCKECYQLANKKWRDNNSQKKKDLNTDWYYRTTYGITYTEFLEVCTKQDNKCKICNTDLQFSGKSNKSAVQDHNHETGQLRGVLCNACNVGLGHFKDNKDVLNKAIDYLKEYEN